jgi:hypothetical protein
MLRITSNQYALALKMATETFVETVESFSTFDAAHYRKPSYDRKMLQHCWLKQ